jgi:hypothetical protein
MDIKHPQKKRFQTQNFATIQLEKYGKRNNKQAKRITIPHLVKSGTRVEQKAKKNP